MASWAIWALGIAGLLIVGVVAYWQLVIAEGTYLGQRVVTALYDLVADRYDSIKQFDADIESLFVGRPLATALCNMPAPLVLDIATGTARLPLTLLAQPSFQGKIVGLDDSHRMLRVAARKTDGYSGRLTLLWLDAARLPFPDDTFDAVTCLEMVEFVPNPKSQLVEAMRVLRPGGVLLTTRRRGSDARLMPGKTHTPGQFIALLEGLGLTGVRLEAWQVDYDLAWGWRAGQSGGGVRPVLEILRCPCCGRVALVEKGQSLFCENCGATYPIRDRIIELQGGAKRNGYVDLQIP